MSHFDDAVRRWAESQGIAEASGINSDDYAVIRRGLLAFLAAHAGDLTNWERQEVVDEAITRMAQAVQSDRVDPQRSPAGYLLTITRHVLVDRYRRSVNASGSYVQPSTEADDDAVVQLLDRLATAALVRAALRRTVQRRDWTTVNVVAAWLDLAAELVRNPTSREVSAQVGVSKTAVSDSLERFRVDLEWAREDR
ncbi:sigma factor [Streptomyces platensis]|uniref:sigma factor n=1 Tax=Streptomyces platensis TaxID=58346 RepID=UPI00332C9AEC